MGRDNNLIIEVLLVPVKDTTCTQYLSNFDQPVPVFLDSLSFEAKLQGAGDQHKKLFGFSEGGASITLNHVSDSLLITLYPWKETTAKLCRKSIEPVIKSSFHNDES